MGNDLWVFNGLETMTFDEFIETDEGVARFGLILNPLWVEAAKIGWDAATQAEREACAKICEEEADYYSDVVMEPHGGNAAYACAETIRLRSTPHTPLTEPQVPSNTP